MPKLQIFIKKELVEEIEIKLQGQVLESRLAEVKDASTYLLYKYRQSIQVTSDWEIILINVTSKMNS